MLLATWISGVGMRVAVTTMVSGPSSSSACAAAAASVKGRMANIGSDDLRTGIS
jgi:hypothetical protein